MKKFVYILLLTLTVSSCSEYQKALKSEDVKTKLDMATTLFEAGKYNKAEKLFKQVLPKYRGKPQVGVKSKINESGLSWTRDGDS